MSEAVSDQSRADTVRSSSALSARSLGAHFSSAAVASLSAVEIRSAISWARAAYGLRLRFAACRPRACACGEVNPAVEPPSGVFPSTLSGPGGYVTDPSGFTVSLLAPASASAASSFCLAAAMSKAKPFSAVLITAHWFCVYWKFRSTSWSSPCADFAASPSRALRIPAATVFAMWSFEVCAMSARAR